MQVFRSIDEIPANFGPSVITIGNFDGVHRGHRTVIADVIRRAHTLGAISVAVTFDPHPVRLLHPEIPLRLITPTERKLALLIETGIDAMVVLPFTHALSRLSPEEFARQILRDKLHAVEVQEGENFRFGADARADIHDLARLGKVLGFDALAHQPSLWHGRTISSSSIRTAIAEGDVCGARRMLGRPFSIVSHPASGRGYGSRYTVPTINFAPYAELVPGNGVYVTCLEASGHRFESVSNVGNRPTFGKDSFAIETHILDFEPFLLAEDTDLRLIFLKRLRAEIIWPSPEALKEQIERDVQAARRYFSLLRAASTVSEAPPL